MYKASFISIVLLIFAGCANFQITGMMCDQVRMDPHAMIPSECRRYSEKDAQKAFDKETNILSTKDAIEFTN